MTDIHRLEVPYDRSKIESKKIERRKRRIGLSNRMGVNGYPCFGAMHCLHKEDWTRAKTAIRALEEKRAKDLDDLKV